MSELSTVLLRVGLRCYVCDSRSVIGYYDAEKDCNTDRSLQQCPDAKVFNISRPISARLCRLYSVCMVCDIHD